jgi:hypothetical protein
LWEKVLSVLPDSVKRVIEGNPNMHPKLAERKRKTTDPTACINTLGWTM